MKKVRPGMSQSQVRGILGEPDDVRGPGDLSAITTAGTKLIWCYGTDGHLSFPTLGCVYFDGEDKVQYAFGSTGSAPDASLFSEKELRTLLRLVNQAPPLAGRTFNPLTVIRIVNGLLPLGKKQALAAIEEYLRVSSLYDCPAREGTLIVLRTLFDVPERGFLPQLNVGVAIPAEPGNPRLIPRFPVFLADDVPLLMVSGYDLIGEAELLESQLGFYYDHGQIRAKRLIPSKRPLDGLERLLNSPQWIYDARLNSAESNTGKVLIMNQLLRLVRSVYDPKPELEGYAGRRGFELDKEWKSIVSGFERLDVLWNEEKNEYTFKNGSTLAPEKRHENDGPKPFE
jgi:hypothetical protein